MLFLCKFCVRTRVFIFSRNRKTYVLAYIMRVFHGQDDTSPSRGHACENASGKHCNLTLLQRGDTFRRDPRASHILSRRALACAFGFSGASRRSRPSRAACCVCAINCPPLGVFLSYHRPPRMRHAHATLRFQRFDENLARR